MSLLEVPGYELGMAAALAALPAGVALGVRQARRELAAPLPSPARALWRAALPLALALAALFAGDALWAALRTPCRPAAGAGPFWLAALPSALLSAALGVGAGLAARGRRLRAGLLAAAVVLSSLAAALARGYLGPSAAVSDHFLGFWPGPIYDEAIRVDRRLLLFRLGTLGWALALPALGALGSQTGGWRRRGPVLAAALGLAVAAGARLAGGGPAGRAEVEAALSGELRGPRCLVHYPAEWSAARAERLLRDCETSAAQVARALALPAPPRTEVFVYRSPAEKRRLVAAGHTSFTKPWLREIHVNDEASPRPVLRHELVHALASAFAPWPLRVPARGGLLVRAGLVEGLAAALEPPRGAWTVHQWARALRDLGLLPPAGDLLGDAGFLAAPPARAYAAAGSLVAWVLESRGPEAVRALYRSGDPARALDEPAEALTRGWQGFLDGVAVPPALAAAAALRFREPGLFGRSCARESADLAEEARALAGAGRAAEAERAYRRLSALAGGDPAPLRDAAAAWAGRDPSRAEALLGEALAGAGAPGQRALRAGLLAALGDLALATGDGGAAARRYREALPLATGGAETRTLEAKEAAAGDPALATAAGPWLLGHTPREAALAALAGSSAPLARYLQARAALAEGKPRRALALLQTLDLAALPGPDFAAEVPRLEAAARCDAGDWDLGAAAWRAQAAAAAEAGERLAALDAAWRCAFEGETWGRPVE